MEIVQFLILPFLASLILTGIHAYLGVHVVERGVIFVDLALAQIAALGATMAILIGMDPTWRGRLLDEPGLHLHWRADLYPGSVAPETHSTRSLHRHHLCGRLRSRHSRHEQGYGRNRTSEGHAGRQYSRRVPARRHQDGRAL